MQANTKSKIIGAAVGGSLVLLIVFLCAPFLHDVWRFLVQKALPQLTPEGHLSLLAILATLCLFELGWIASLSRRMSRRFVMREYRPHPTYKRMMVHKKRPDEIVCSACLATGEVVKVVPRGTGVECPKKDCLFDDPGPEEPASGSFVSV
jgi:hypothetical protein